MAPCNDKSELLVCEHVIDDTAETEVLLVGDDCSVHWALCLPCSVSDPNTVPVRAMCRECGKKLDIPSIMPTPGKWQVGALNAN